MKAQIYHLTEDENKALKGKDGYKEWGKVQRSLTLRFGFPFVYCGSETKIYDCDNNYVISLYAN